MIQLYLMNLRQLLEPVAASRLVITCSNCIATTLISHHNFDFYDTIDSLSFSLGIMGSIYYFNNCYFDNEFQGCRCECSPYFLKCPCECDGVAPGTSVNQTRECFGACDSSLDTEKSYRLTTCGEIAVSPTN